MQNNVNRSLGLKAKQTFRLFDGRQTAHGIFVTFAIIFHARHNFRLRNRFNIHALDFGKNLAHFIGKFRNREFVIRVPDVKRLREGYITRFKQREHKIDRIKDARETALCNTAIHKLQRLPPHKRRREIRKHTRNARAIDARHKIHERSDKVEGSNHGPLQILETRNIALCQ